jgi:hypothetical protein
MKLEFRAEAFAGAVKEVLEERRWSYADAQREAPFINKAMISRAINGGHVCLNSFLALCGAFDLGPLDFIEGRSGENVIEIQPVTVGISRETRAGKELWNEQNV